MSVYLPEALFAGTLGQARFAELAGRWRESALVHESGPGQLSLTANGSWFAGTMMAEIAGLV
jgi:hypothetical protein